MERIYHIDVVKVGRSRLVGEIDRVIKRKIPDREGLEFRISCTYSALVFMVKLRKAGSHLSASGTRSRDNDKRTCGFDIFVLAEALVADDPVNVGGVSRYRVMVVHLDAEIFKPLAESVRRRLCAVSRHNNAADKQSYSPESVNKPEHVQIVGYTEISSDFVLLDIRSVDHNNDLSLILELHEHLDLAVGSEAGQNSRRMVVVKKLAAELKIELAAELSYSFLDMLRLHLNIFFIVKSDFFQHQHLKIALVILL